MNVDASKAGPVEDRARQQQSVRGNDPRLGVERNQVGLNFRIAQADRLSYRNSALQGGLFYGTIGLAQSPARGPVGLRQYGHDVVSGMQQGAQRNGGEFGRTGKNQAHGTIAYSSGAAERGRRSGTAGRKCCGRLSLPVAPACGGG